MSTPRYPDQDNEPVLRSRNGRARWVVAAVVVVLVGFIVLHLAGVFGH